MQMLRGSTPWMPSLVITAMAPVMASPRLHANTFGRADAHCGARCRVIHPASIPAGLRSRPAVTRMRKSSANKGVTVRMSQNVCSKLAYAKATAPSAIVTPAAART